MHPNETSADCNACNSRLSAFFSACASCTDKTSSFLKSTLRYAAEHRWVKPVVSTFLAGASAALAYLAATAYQEDENFSAVYTVIPSTVAAVFLTQLSMEYAFPNVMKRINHYRALYTIEWSYMTPVFLNGIMFGRLLPGHNGIKQEWVYYFTSSSVLGTYFGEILANLLRRRLQSSAPSNAIAPLQLPPKNASDLLPEYIAGSSVEPAKSQNSRCYKGTVFFTSAAFLSAGYVIRYLYSEQYAIDPLSVISLFLRHVALASLGALITEEVITRLEKYDTHTLQQISLYLLGPTIQLGNQPYHDVWLLLTGAVVKINQYYATTALIEERNNDKEINAQLRVFFEGKEDLISQMQSNVLLKMHQERGQKIAGDIAYNLFLLGVCVYSSTYSAFRLGSAYFISATILAITTTPYIYRWLKNNTYTALPPQQQKVWDTLNYYLSHNLIPLGAVGIYLSRMIIRYRRLVGELGLLYPNNDLSVPDKNPDDPVAILVGLLYGVLASIWIAFFRSTRREFGTKDFTQENLNTLKKSLEEDNESVPKEKTVFLSHEKQAAILSRIGMFPKLPSCREKQVVSTAQELTDSRKIKIESIANAPFEKSRDIHVRTMLSFFYAIQMSNNASSRIAVVDSAREIIWGL
jgi:hypothetical protein